MGEGGAEGGASGRFLVAGESEFEAYPKLKNARIYGELGYAMPQFFVLRDPDIISSVLSKGRIPRGLARDLKTLCSQPFVLRTDACGLAKDDLQMLPSKIGKAAGREVRVQYV